VDGANDGGVIMAVKGSCFGAVGDFARDDTAAKVATQNYNLT
jgi:hypothetical protein